MKGIACVEVVTVNQRQLLATASELSVRLWTIQGQYLGVLGQAGSWTHLGVLETAPHLPAKAPAVARVSKERSNSSGGFGSSLSPDGKGFEEVTSRRVSADSPTYKNKEHHHSYTSLPSRRSHIAMYCNLYVV